MRKKKNLPDIFVKRPENHFHYIREVLIVKEKDTDRFVMDTVQRLCQRMAITKSGSGARGIVRQLSLQKEKG